MQKKAGAAVTVVAFGVDVIIDVKSGDSLAEAVFKNAVVLGVAITTVAIFTTGLSGAPLVLVGATVGYVATKFAEFWYENSVIIRYINDNIFKDHDFVEDTIPLPSRPEDFDDYLN